MIAKMLKPLLKTSPSRLIGANSINDISSASVSIPVPSGTINGDLLIIIARCRNDRTISFPPGWSVVFNESQGSESSDMKTYIATKIRSDDVSVSFTQNVSSALSGMVISARNSRAKITKGSGDVFTYVKDSYNSDLIVAYLCNGMPSEAWPSSSFINGFSLIASSRFFYSFYYYCIFSHYNSNRVASIDIKISPPSSEGKLPVIIELY